MPRVSAPPSPRPARPALSVVRPFPNLVGILKKTVSRFIDDELYRLGASVAYYALFSLFPLMLVAIGIIGFVLGDNPELRTRALHAVSTSNSPEYAALVDNTLTSMRQHRTAGGVGAVIGVVTLVVGASAVFSELDTALNTVWRAPKKASSGIRASILDFVKEKLLAFGLVFLTAILLLGSLVASAAVTWLSKDLHGVLAWGFAWQLANFFVASAFLTVAFAAMFKVLPRCTVEWKDALAGGLLTTLLFAVLRHLFAWYLGNLGSYAAYGAVGAVLGLLTWIYFSSQVLFFGGTFARIFAEARGTAASDSDAPAEKVPGAKAPSEKREKPSRQLTPRPV